MPLLHLSAEYQKDSDDPSLLTNNEICPYWRVICDIDQTMVKKIDSRVGAYGESAYCLIKHFLRVYGEGNHPYLQDNAKLFLFWKNAAWVNSKDAEALAYVLRHGFFDDKRIPVNHEWADVWDARARLLKKQKDQWWHPRETRDRANNKFDHTLKVNQLQPAKAGSV
jgi:hypothetical protein